MGIVTGLTAERMLAIEASSVVSGAIDENGDLILEQRDGTLINGGNVIPGLEILLPAIRDFMYPIGKIYFSADATDPGTLFGGTWVPWGAGRVPVGVDSSQTEFDTVEETGGEKTHLLTSGESGLVAHNHTQNAHGHTQDSHTHTQNSHNHTQNSHNHTQNSHSHTQNSHTHGPGNKAQYGMYDATTSQETMGELAGTGWNLLQTTGTVAGASATGAATAINQSTTATNDATTATNQVATATNQSTTATNQSTTATNNSNAAANASSAHNNLQPYITCYMWKRTA